MADGKTYGIDFPFNNSSEGNYLKLTQTANDEIRANLIHLLLTRKGSRYFLPDFGTRLYEFIFDPLDTPSFNNIEADIREACEKYLPQLKITNITITTLQDNNAKTVINSSGDAIANQYNISGSEMDEYTAKVKIDYLITDDVFSSKDFVILNI